MNVVAYTERRGGDPPRAPPTELNPVGEFQMINVGDFRMIIDTLPYIDQQLGIATFMVALKAACTRRGIIFHWRGHYLDNPKIGSAHHLDNGGPAREAIPRLSRKERGVYQRLS